MNLDQFKKDVRLAVNKNSVENLLNMPDYIVAEMVVDMLKAVGESKKNSDNWHGYKALPVDLVTEN